MIKIFKGTLRAFKTIRKNGKYSTQAVAVASLNFSIASINTDYIEVGQ